MRVKVSIAAGAHAISLVVAFCLVYRSNQPAANAFHAGLFAGIALLYWLVGATHYFKLRKAHPKNATERFAEFIYPMTALVVLNVLLMGFFAFADDHYRSAIAARAGGAKMPILEWAHFGVSIIEVFPAVFFPLGVVMYAFWGAFIYNTYSFLQRIMNDDFYPRVVILGTLRVVLAVFASILIYFAFFPGAFDFTTFRTTGIVTIGKGGETTLGLLIVASFFAGLYPRQSLMMALRWSAGRLSQAVSITGKYTYSPLTMIQGITLDIEDRLNEAGIDSIQALATCSVQDMTDARRLPYPERTITDWQDQAKLAVYFTDEAELAAVCNLGIRTYSALLTYQAQAKTDPTILDGLDPTPLAKDKFRHFVLYGVFPGP